MGPIKATIKQVLGGAVASLVLAGAAHAQPTACPKEPGIGVAITVTMEQFYAAAKADDRAALKAVVAPDFYAYDGGKRYTADGLMSMVEGAYAAGKHLEWTVTQPEPHVIDCDWAWLSWVTQGSVKDEVETESLSWLESAVLHREGGRWKVKFFHSTRVPPAK